MTPEKANVENSPLKKPPSNIMNEIVIGSPHPSSKYK